MAWSRNWEQAVQVLSGGYCPLSIFRKVKWLILESYAEMGTSENLQHLLCKLKKPHG